MEMEKIDCLFIGHNEMDFAGYEKNIKKMGIHSGAYRDLNLNFIQYNDTLYTALDIFNLFYCSNKSPGEGCEPLYMGETFNPAVAYLGTYLDRRGYTFDYVNSFQEEKEELAEKISRDMFHSVAIITTLYVSPLPIIEIVDFIKKYNQTVKIIVGGPFVSTQCRTQDNDSLEYLFKTTIGADIYLNSSQGETTLLKILDALKNNLPLDRINNIYYKKGNDYVLTPPLRENNKLSENMVNWGLFADRIGEYANIRTAISCPFSCSFCGFPQHAGKYQTAGVNHIEQELIRLRRLEKVRYIHFIDDTFNVPVKRFKEILRMLIKNKFGFRWYSHFRCQFADREMVELMKESGCEGVFLGIESGNDQILKNMNKAAAVEQYLKGIALLKEYEILTYGSFIVGFPGETEETLKDTLRFIQEGGIDFYRAQLWYCEPITPIWRQREKYKLSGESFEWSHATMDSRRAMDLVEEILLTAADPIWVPQYNFECDALFHLFPDRIPLEKLKNFLKAFTNGLKEKLLDRSKQEISFDIIKQLKTSLQDNDDPEESLILETDLSDKFDAEFDF